MDGWHAKCIAECAAAVSQFSLNVGWKYMPTRVGISTKRVPAILACLFAFMARVACQNQLQNHFFLNDMNQSTLSDPTPN